MLLLTCSHPEVPPTVRPVTEFEFLPCHSGTRAQPARPESMNAGHECLGKACVHGLRARPGMTLLQSRLGNYPRFMTIITVTPAPPGSPAIRAPASPACRCG